MTEAAKLRGNIGYFQFLSLGFGTMIGSAWVILLGNWLGEAGPGGAVLGFAGGAVIVMTIGACYAELSVLLPEAGSEFIYAHRVYGRGVAFAVGWFLILYLISVTVFEAIALAWIAEMLIPAWKSAALYTAFGSSITTEMLLVGIGAALVIFSLNLIGTQVAMISHSILTYGFLFVVLGMLGALLAHGRVDNMQPLFATTNGKPWWWGTGGIFAFCAYALNGFQAIPQAIEERSGSTNLRTIGIIIIASIAAAAAFYCLVVIAASVATPWRTLVAAPLPMIAAAATLPHGDVFVLILLLATAASLVKAWNGVFMMAVRLTVAMARAGYIPHTLARLHRRSGSPAAALIFVAALNIGGIFIGKAAIEPITDMCAMVLTLTYVMCCMTVLRLRFRSGAAPFPLPGGNAFAWIGLCGSVAMTVVAFLAPFLQRGGLPPEWELLGVWGVIGCAVWLSRMRYAANIIPP